MRTQLPRIVPIANSSAKTEKKENAFSQSIKGAYINDRSDYEVFRSVADLSNDDERRHKHLSFEQRIRNSQHFLKRAYRTMHNTMLAVAQGQRIPLEQLHALIHQLLEHLERHADTALYQTRQKNKGEYTYMRSVSFCVVLLDFTKTLGFNDKDLLHIGTGALLHDAGKMWIPGHILNKPGKLTRREFLEIKEHIKFSEMILYNNRITNQLSRDVSLQHHERNDGSGYPYGLLQHQISDIGQIAAIVDVYDALTSNRCYRSQQQPSHALKYLLTQEKKFNTEYVQRFVHHIGIYPIGSTVKLSNNLIGIVIEKGRHLLRPTVKAIYDETTGRQIPPSRIVLEDMESLFITQALSPAQLGFRPQRFIF